MFRRGLTILAAVVVLAAATGCGGRLERGQSKLKHGKYESAVSLLEKYVAGEPDSVKGLGRLGHAYLKTGRVDDAITVLKKALAIDPKDPDAGLYLGMAYLAKEDFANAIQTWKNYHDPKQTLINREVSHQLSLLQIAYSQRLAMRAIADEKRLMAAQHAPALQPGAPQEAYYVVQEGDSLGDIAARTGVDEETLKQLYGADGALIKAGQRFRIAEHLRPPAIVPAAEYYVVKDGDSLEQVSEMTGVPEETLKQIYGEDGGLLAAGQKLKIAENLRPAAAPPVEEAALDPNTVAVCYYEDLSPDKALRAFQKGLTAMVITDLAKIKALKVVERVRLQALLEEMKLGQTGIVDPQTAPRVGRLLGADKLIVGNLSPGSIQAATSAASASSAKVVGTAVARVQEKQFFELPIIIVHKVVEIYGVRLTPEEEEAVGVPHTKNYDAFIFYGKGLDAFDNGQWREARRNFDKAVRLDPNFKLAREARDSCPSASAPTVAALKAMSAAELSAMVTEAVDRAVDDQQYDDLHTAVLSGDSPGSSAGSGGHAESSGGQSEGSGGSGGSGAY